jgi:muramoyltetrapeptide carboxypeptidase
MSLVRPNRLRPGDTIGIISPASPVAAFCPRRLERGIDELKRMGFTVVVSKHTSERTGHTAGTIQQRLDDLHEMFSNPEVRCIITTIGGYNSHHLLDELDFDLIKQHPKILMGYSDITSLLVAIHHVTTLVTFMGPAILPQFGEFGGLLDYTEQSFENVLMKAQSPGVILTSDGWTDELLLWDHEDDRRRQTKPNSGPKVVKSGQASGPILAGNAGTLLLLAGTPYFPDLEGKILCLEDDESETPATIDRYFTQLRQMGVFSKISGLVIGRFHSKVPFTIEDSLEQLLLTATRGYSFPIVYGADFGHTDPMMVLPNGVEAKLDASDEQPLFKINESAVQ